MRYQELNELSGVKKFATMDHQEVLNYLKKTLGDTNFKPLGSGAHGTAVLVGNTVYKFWMMDSAYTDFVKYAKKKPNNPFLPKFLSEIRRMPAFFFRDASAPDWVYYVKVEPLTKLSGDLSEQYIEMPFKDQSGRKSNIALDLETIINCVKQTNSYKECLQKIGMSFGVSLDENTAPALLRGFLGVLWDLEALDSHYLDLHKENFMMRGDQLVILDPIANIDDNAISNNISSFLELSKKEKKVMGKQGERKIPTSSAAIQPR